MIISKMGAEILRCVLDGADYGFAIVERGYSRGSVYVILGRLEAAGLVESAKEEGTQGSIRRYNVTPAGRRILAAWTRLEQAADQERRLP